MVGVVVIYLNFKVSLLHKHTNLQKTTNRYVKKPRNYESINHLNCRRLIVRTVSPKDILEAATIESRPIFPCSASS